MSHSAPALRTDRSCPMAPRLVAHFVEEHLLGPEVAARRAAEVEADTGLHTGPVFEPAPDIDVPVRRRFEVPLIGVTPTTSTNTKEARPMGAHAPCKECKSTGRHKKSCPKSSGRWRTRGGHTVGGAPQKSRRAAVSRITAKRPDSRAKAPRGVVDMSEAKAIALELVDQLEKANVKIQNDLAMARALAEGL